MRIGLALHVDIGNESHLSDGKDERGSNLVVSTCFKRCRGNFDLHEVLDE